MNKLLAIESFQVNLLKTGLFNNAATVYLSYLVLLSEFSVLMLLVFKKKMGLFALLIMLIAFTTYISVLRFLGRYEVCGCGGILNGLQFKYHLGINLGLILLAFYVYSIGSKKLQNED